jgi:alkaline phosphatase
MKEAIPGLTLDDVLPIIKENFGLIAPTDPDASVEANAIYVLTDYEFLKSCLRLSNYSMLPEDQRKETDDETALLSAVYDPFPSP